MSNNIISNNNSGSSLASTALSAVSTVAQTTARFLPQPVSAGVNFAASLLPNSNTQTVDISSNYQALIEKQIQIQLEQQQVTFTSNIEKSQHESRMAAVRNIRLG
jgi:hypothetical protein